MAVKIFTLLAVAWCCTAVPASAQRGAFPWKRGTRAPVFGGIRLGDTRAHVDSVLGPPSSADTIDEDVVFFRHDRKGVMVSYSRGGGVDVIFATTAATALGEVKVGQSMDEVRTRWGPPNQVDGQVSIYTAGEWAVLVAADSTRKRVGTVGLSLMGDTPTQYDVPDTTDVFRLAVGTWDWTGTDGFCRDNPHTITFSPDRKFMILTFAKPDTGDDGQIQQTYRYEIRGHTKNSVRGFIEGEDRRTDAGELVVWDLVLMSPDEYRWHRTDWDEGGFTKGVLRCR